MYLVDYASHKSVAEMAAGQHASTDDMLAQSDTIQRHWARAFEYAGKLRASFSEYTAHVKREIAKSKMTEAEWFTARAASRTFNLERYTVRYPRDS